MFWTVAALAILCMPLACESSTSAKLLPDAATSGQRCEDPIPLVQTQASDTQFFSDVTTVRSGLERCADRSYHRVQAVSCLPGWERVGACSCEPHSFDAGIGCSVEGVCYQAGGCATSDDCNSGEVCLCSTAIDIDDVGGGYQGFNDSRCVPAGCETDADCGGFECGVSQEFCQVDGLFCHTAEDECHGPEDCENDGCAFTGMRWECTGSVDCE